MPRSRRISLPKTRKTSKIGPKSRRKTPKKVRNPNKRKSSSRSNNMAKKKSPRRNGKFGGNKIKKGAIGGAVGVATTAVANRLGARSISDDLGYVLASITGGGTPGVVGNAVIRQGLTRFGGSLNILNGGSSNGNAVTNTGFA